MGCVTSSAGDEDCDGTSIEINLQKKRLNQPELRAPKDGQSGNMLQEPNLDDEWFDRRSHTTEKDVLESIRNLDPGELFEDPDFKCDLSSLGLGVFKSLVAEHNLQEVKWMRPKELCEKPKLYVDGVSRTDIIQGNLGNCWLLSACAAIARSPGLIEKVISPAQPLHDKHHRGVIKVNFWRFGSWVTVFIDDRLPTLQGKLLFSRSSDRSEFWISLLEKAYAKLNGSYSKLIGGHAVDALVDLTGGLAEIHLLNNNQRDQEGIFGMLLRSTAWGAFITCRRPGDWTSRRKADEKGLVSGHAYTVTGAAMLKIHGSRVPVIRVRNPWGDYEWNGSWSDRDRKNWSAVSEEAKKLMEFQEKEDGEFWIGLQDFCKEFEAICICTVGPDYDADGQCDSYQVNMITGSWVPGCNAGGSRNNPSKFATNPQFLLEVTEPDGDPGQENLCNMIISLLQKDIPNMIGEDGWHQIGFFVFQASRLDTRLTRDDLHNITEPLVSTGKFVNLREVWKRVQLPPGRYILIPATFLPNQAADFLIRVFSKKPVIIQAI